MQALQLMTSLFSVYQCVILMSITNKITSSKTILTTLEVVKQY